jgi:hypothetical protein
LASLAHVDQSRGVLYFFFVQSVFVFVMSTLALGVCAHVLLTGTMPPFVTSPDGRGVDPAAQLDAMMREGGPEIDLSGHG